MQNWFEIDCDGWKRMNAGRPIGHLIREAISNSFDEDTVTNIKILLEPGHVKIEDNGQRNQDIHMLFTIFMTDKKDSHLKRGRKGRGLKELLSVANTATIQTIGHTITFNENGRTVTNNNITQGTIIEINTNWTAKQIKEALQYISKIIVPEGKTITITTKQRTTTLSKPALRKEIRTVNLQTTIIENDIEKIFQSTTDVNTYELREGEKTGWIYEMGIPIEESKTNFHIDVQQRIPMNDNRDTISDEYKEILFGTIMNNTMITKELLTEKWVILGASQMNYSTVHQISNILTDNGRKVVKTSKAADDIAKQNGYEILDLSTMPNALRNRIRYDIPDSEDVCKKIEDTATPVQPNEDMKKFSTIMSWLAEKVIGKETQIRFYTKNPNFTGAIERANYTDVVEKGNYACISYNCHPRAENDFSKPLSARNISTFVHEMAHNKAPYHDDDFIKALQDIAGKLTYTIMHKRDELDKMLDGGGFLSGKTCKINCVDCGKEREIKVQDRHQVKRCIECQKIAKKLRAKEKKNEKQD